MERVGGGLRSALYRTLYGQVKVGGVSERRVSGEARRQFHEDARAAGISKTPIEMRCGSTNRSACRSGRARCGHGRAAR